MDPNYAVTKLLAETVLLRGAIDMQDREQVLFSLNEILGHAGDLEEWIKGGGFLPSAAMDGGANPT